MNGRPELDIMLVLHLLTDLYLGQVLNHQTVVESVHLGEEEFWYRGLNTGTGVAFLIKTERWKCC